MKRFGLFCAAMCLVAGFATACGGSSNSSQEPATGTATLTASPSGTAEATTSGPAAASAATITIANMNFGEPVTVPPGGQITIKNDDSAEHSVTSDTAGKFDVEVEGTTYRESEHEQPGDEPVLTQAGGVEVGLTICYDLRFPELFRILAVRGARILTVPSAFTLPTTRDCVARS